MERHFEKYDSVDTAYARHIDNYNKFQSNITNSTDLEIESIQELKDIVENKFDEKINSPEELFEKVSLEKILDYKIREKTEIISGKIWFNVLEYEILEESLNYKPKNYFEHIVTDDYRKNKRIVVKPNPRLRLNYYNTNSLFNDFVRLGIKYNFEYGKGADYYPNDSDREKIIKFISKYGFDFIEYPPLDKKDWRGWTYFEEFSLHYREFMCCYNKITRKGLLVEPEDFNELVVLNSNLDKIKYNIEVVKLKKDKKIIDINIFKPTVKYKIHYCYDRLKEILVSKQPIGKCKCCKEPFIPSRKDRVFCSKKCKNRFAQTEFQRRKRLK